MTSAKSTTLAAAAALSGLLVGARALLLVITVKGESMTPTFQPEDRLLMLRRPLIPLRAGAVVVFRLPQSEREGPAGGTNPLLVKRIAATAGQPIPAAVLPAVGAQDGDLVPRGRLVLLADAGGASGDSRSWGYIAADSIQGVIIGRLSR